MSSQFLSGLLMAAPFARERRRLSRSTGHWCPALCRHDADMMRQLGASSRCRTGDSGFHVPGRRTWAGMDRYAIEPDASAASYFWAAAAVTGEVSVGVTVASTMTANSLQGDVRFVDVLEEMGCQVVRGAGRRSPSTAAPCTASTWT